MSFDNSSPPSPSSLTAVKQHLPLAMLIVGFAFAFIGLHVATAGLVALAAAHVLGAAVVYATRRYGGRHRHRHRQGHRHRPPTASRP